MKRRKCWLRLLPLGGLLMLAATSAVPAEVAAQPQSVDIWPYYNEGPAPLSSSFTSSAYDM